MSDRPEFTIPEVMGAIQEDWDDLWQRSLGVFRYAGRFPPVALVAIPDKVVDVVLDLSTAESQSRSMELVDRMAIEIPALWVVILLTAYSVVVDTRGMSKEEIKNLRSKDHPDKKQSMMGLFMSPMLGVQIRVIPVENKILQDDKEICETVPSTDDLTEALLPIQYATSSILFYTQEVKPQIPRSDA